MGRRPKGPWFRKSCDAWFVTIDGTQHQLARGKENIDEATRRNHELMAAPRTETVKTDSVLAIVDLFLGWCRRHRAADTYDWYLRRLQRLCDSISAELRGNGSSPESVDGIVANSAEKYWCLFSVPMGWAGRGGKCRRFLADSPLIARNFATDREEAPVRGIRNRRNFRFREKAAG